jgi:hypothetical protein
MVRRYYYKSGVADRWKRIVPSKYARMLERAEKYTENYGGTIKLAIVEDKPAKVQKTCIVLVNQVDPETTWYELWDKEVRLYSVLRAKHDAHIKRLKAWADEHGYEILDWADFSGEKPR